MTGEGFININFDKMCMYEILDNQEYIHPYFDIDEVTDIEYLN